MPALRRLPRTVGPAFVAAVAYVDPGNVATNFAAGARHGFLLVWVVVAASLMAMPVQYLSAKVGLATGQTLPQLCREHLSQPVTLLLWGVAELVAMATELAELLGSALALHLLFGLDLLPAGIIGASVSFLVLVLTNRGSRSFEITVAVMLAAVALGFGYQAVVAGLRPAEVVSGLLPRLSGADSLMLTVGIVGATVMPHAIYVHSALATAGRGAQAPGQALRTVRWDVATALSVASLVNLTMLAVAALALGEDHRNGDTLLTVHDALGTALGGTAALAFAVALLVSGVSSTSVGAYAGQVVMGGFTGRHLPVTVRWLVTVAPALAVLATGVDPTQALIGSQVVLSFGLPFVLVPLLMFTTRRSLMGCMVNRRSTTVTVSVIVVVITMMNLVLLAGPNVPGT